MVIPLTNYDVVLGKRWLLRRNPAINFRKNEIAEAPSLDTNSISYSGSEVELSFIVAVKPDMLGETVKKAIWCG